MTLSIIIPYYNAKEYTDELLACLDKQINDEVEVIVVDDGSPEPYKTDYKWCTVIRQKNKRCSGARNTGLKKAGGDYIQFIDADDMIPHYFIRRLFREIRENDFDVCDFSWKSLDTDGVQHNKKIRDKDGRLNNPSVCTRCFSRTYIGNTKFNEKKDSTEDEDFSRKLGYLDPTRPHKHTAISEYMYYYRTSVDNSKIKRFKKGLMNTKRIVYHYNHVTADMKNLLREIKEEDKTNEVWLLTEKCNIPELSRYCQISKPMQIWAHELRGEPLKNCTIIAQPLHTQVVIYCEYCATVGGIPTFIYNFCRHMKKYYDIIVAYEKMPPMQVSRLSEMVQTVNVNSRINPDVSIVCDTLILNRLNEKIRDNIISKQTIQICHACRQINFKIPKDRDILVNVSQASKDSWGDECAEGIVIHNMSSIDTKPCLMLVSATRVNVKDKGQNDIRMRKLAEMLEEAGICYIWLNFANSTLKDMPRSFINMPAKENVQPYIEKADYLVQLSDQEAYSMSILEALELGTAVIATPFPSKYEEGFVDEVTGYEVPFNMDFDVSRLLNIPRFEYAQNNSEIEQKWRKLLGDKKPKHNYKPEKHTPVVCIKKYKDIELGRTVKAGEILMVSESRAQAICKAGYAKRGTE